MLMPDEIKPDEISQEKPKPENEAASINAVADQPDEPAEVEAEPEPKVDGEAEAMTGESADDLSAIQVDADGDSAAESAMKKMIEDDAESEPEGESRPDLEDEFPDLSQVQPEETIANPAEFQQLGPSPVQATSASNIDLLLDVKMPVSIELGRTDLPISEILTLGPGSVVELDKLAGEPVDLLVNDKIIAKGEVVVVDENFGVRITMLMSPEERLKSLAQQ
jgi:flagellar motor switch protein FliN/FliY